MLPNPFALEIEAAYKQDDAMRLAARERAGRAPTPAPVGSDRPTTRTGLRATAVAAREGLAASTAWLRAVDWIAATRRRPVA